MDPSKVENLPTLPSKIKVNQVGIRDCSATKDRDTIKVHGKGWIDLCLNGNSEIGELQVMDDFPITYSAEFTNDRTLLSCKAVVKR
jgi:hypothetical protein